MDGTTILFLCTGNICRSPVAEVLLRRRLGQLGVDATVASAGLLPAGNPAAAHGIDILQGRGLDLSSHRSRSMTQEILSEADLILGMARDHVREAVIRDASVWPRTFTLKELVRRGRAVGPRRPDEPLRDWLARAHEGRTKSDLMGSSRDDDVADPIGGPRSAFERMTDELDELIDRLVRLAFAGALTPR